MSDFHRCVCYRCPTNMAKDFQLRLTDRDGEILEALDRFPVTAEQLCKLSGCFGRPFGDAHAVRRRMRKLAASSLVLARPYAVASFGSSPAYYKLTRGGYRMLHGPDVQLPKRRYFDAIGQARHPHTRALVDLLVHLFVATSEAGYRVQRFARENSVVFDTSVGELRPDAAFQIQTERRAFNFVVECDRGTERVQSSRDTESIERKLRGYLSHAKSLSAFDRNRYVVLFVTSRSGLRLKHIMAHASAITMNWQRTLFLGISLADFLSADRPLDDACFWNPQFKSASMIPSPKTPGSQPVNLDPNLLPSFPVFC